MKTIMAKIKTIGGMLSLVILSDAAITGYVNHMSARDSVLINVAGKERMLSQQITKEVFWLKNSNTSDFGALDAARNEFETSLNDLIKGNEKREIHAPPEEHILERLLQVQSLWKTFDGYVKRFKQLHTEMSGLEALLQEQSEAVLAISEHVVKQMVADGLGGEYIDDAGRQRMLTQRIGLSAMQYLNSGEPVYFTRFQNAHQRYGATLERFIKDETIRQQSGLQRLLSENEGVWGNYTAYMLGMMHKQREINEVVSQIKMSNLVLLQTMDSGVAAYTAYSKEQHDFLQDSQSAATLIALVFMLYAAYLTWQIQRKFEAFLDRSKAMAASVPVDGDTIRFTPSTEKAASDELSQASLHMDEFVDKMKAVLQHAQLAISESEQAAKELSSVSDTIEEQLEELPLDASSRKEIDRSEDIVIQILEELAVSSKLLAQLQESLGGVIEKSAKDL